MAPARRQPLLRDVCQGPVEMLRSMVQHANSAERNCEPPKFHARSAMTIDLATITKVFQTPLTLNAKAGNTILVITDTRMEPVLWQGLSDAARTLGMEPVVTIMPPRETHATDPVSAIRAAAFDDSVDLCIYLT